MKALLIGGKASGTFVPLSGERYCVRTVSSALKDFDEEKAERELLRKLSERRKDGKLSY